MPGKITDRQRHHRRSKQRRSGDKTNLNGLNPIADK
jgi:hypothetical protein